MEERVFNDVQYVRVVFSGDARISVGGKIWVPKKMWVEDDPDYEWSDEVDKYIRENLDTLQDHIDLGSMDDSDIELDAVSLAPSPKPES